MSTDYESPSRAEASLAGRATAVPDDRPCVSGRGATLLRIWWGPRGVAMDERSGSDESLRLADVFARRQRRRNTRALLGYLSVVAGAVILWTLLFQVISRTEGQRHSWITGFYWTLSTMTTLGVGDVVFTSDTGRLFTALVLVSGIVLFLVVLPFAFIRYLYAPWVQAEKVPARLSGHVLIAGSEGIALPLVAKLEVHDIRYFVIEPNPRRAAALQEDGVSAVAGEVDDRATYERLRAAAAGLVVANCDDATNTNITFTVRETAETVPVAALVESEPSVPVLELAGATLVLPLKRRLGEHLANRLNAGHAQTHAIGTFRELVIAEMPVHHTPLVGRRIRELPLRDAIGVNIIGVLEQARFVAAGPDTVLTEHSVPVVVGTREQIAALDEFLVIYDANYSPVLVIGGGKVGCAATHLLRRKGVPVHLVDRAGVGADWIGEPPDKVFASDAAEPDVLIKAGLGTAPGVLLTTSDDAMNIYLAVHCRRLAPETRIVSRVTFDRNLTAMRRAGADIALSHTSLAVESIFAALRGHQLVVLGEGVELHELPVPPSLAGKTLAEAAPGARTGVNVIAISGPAGFVPNPGAATPLPADSSLLMIGDQAQLSRFMREYA
jgi:voltage-gated potassium channel